MQKRPAISLLIKPASGSCDLGCRYCFYADEMNARREKNRGRMTEETLEILVQRALAQASRTATFAFQGGEPTLRGLDFFRRLPALQKKYAQAGVVIHNSLQTNGILIDEEWAKFLHEAHFLVGLSLDGYRELHDENRLFPDGSGSFSQVMRAAHLLQKHRVEFNILTVVTAQAARHGRRLYRFFQQQGLGYQQYIPCIEPFAAAAARPAYALTVQGYGTFLKDVFDCWYADWKCGRPTYERTFENWVGMLLGRPPEACGMCGVCTEQWVVEADGSVYPCDFYVLDEWCLGNIRTDDFEQLAARREELGFVQLSRHVPAQCRACRWYPLCRNGCRRERALLPDGKTPGLNIWCESYQTFFAYAYPRLVEIARSLY